MLKARDRQVTEEAILNAALAEFGDKGFDGARVDSIAERSGFNKAMIYHYFDNKEVLYERVLTNTTTGIFERLNEAVDDSGDPVQVLETLLSRYIDLLDNIDRNVIKIIMRELASGGRYFRKIALPNLVLPMLSIAERIFNAGVVTGRMKRLAPYYTFIQLVGGIIFFNMLRMPVEGTILQERLFQGDYIEQFRGNYFSLVLDGLLNKEG